MPLPCENDSLSRHQLAVFAERAHFLAFLIDEVPPIFATHTRVHAETASANAFWSPPFFELRRIGPRLVDTSGWRIDEPFVLERCLLCGFLVHSPFGLSTNCFSSEPIICVQPASKFFRAYDGVFGNVSIPLCVSFSRVLSPSGNISKVTSESPGSHSYRQV